ncbi:MAG: hypothetical protein WA077_05865 [Anaerolineae bacterium]
MQTSAIDPTTDTPHLRQRLLEIFDDQALTQFCYDRAEFKPVLSSFGTGQGIGQKVQALIEFSDRRHLRDTLIREVNTMPENPSAAAPRPPLPNDTAPEGLSWRQAWLIGAVALLIGILGNLLAAWVQRDLLQDSFTPLRIGLIVGLAALGLLAGAWLERPRPAAEGTARHNTDIHDVSAHSGGEVGVEAPANADLRVDDVHAGLGGRVKIKINNPTHKDAP